MITLRTIDQSTAQEVFDQAATHLLTQAKKSIIGPSCLYRGEDGLKCAAGCFIADDEYNREMEGKLWQIFAEDYGIKKHVNLVSALQFIHDDHAVEAWEDKLQELASSFNLNSDAIFKFLDKEEA